MGHTRGKFLNYGLAVAVCTFVDVHFLSIVALVNKPSLSRFVHLVCYFICVCARLFVRSLACSLPYFSLFISQFLFRLANRILACSLVPPFH